jgi:hypothetical protein
VSKEDRPARPWDLLNKNIGRVESEVASSRFEICKACPELIQLTKTCKKCGCFMEAKTKLPNASCPIGKWSVAKINITTGEFNDGLPS